jgi:methionyl-tRNA formyltransferase
MTTEKQRLPDEFRLLMMGTGPFAVPTFEALLDSPNQVLGLVTRPDRPVHRREKTPVNPMREVAQRRGLEVFEPESINSPESHARLAAWAADLFVVCDYGQILSRETLALAKHGGINLHASLLPKYRGAAPIQWAVYNGETETGVTVIHMTPQLDGGPALVQLHTPIGPEETSPELEARLSTVGIGAVLEAIKIISQGGPMAGIVQNSSQATKAPRLTKELGQVNWTRSAGEIFNQVRALQPWPKTSSFLHRANVEPLRVILERVVPVDFDQLSQATGGVLNRHQAAPGTVIQADKESLVVRCGQQALRIELLQPVGKRAMTVQQFLCGYPVQVGDKFV